MCQPCRPSRYTSFRPAKTVRLVAPGCTSGECIKMWVPPGCSAANPCPAWGRMWEECCQRSTAPAVSEGYVRHGVYDPVSGCFGLRMALLRKGNPKFGLHPGIPGRMPTVLRGRNGGVEGVPRSVFSEGLTARRVIEAFGRRRPSVWLPFGYDPWAYIKIRLWPGIPG